MVLALLLEVPDLPQLLPRALDEDLDIAPAHRDPVGEQAQLAVYTLGQT